MSFLSIKNISFSYKNTQVIKDFSLDVEEGNFTTLLGASGCGKTTLLRLISGFLEPDSGTISIDGKIMNGVLPNKRRIGMVFQDYALFPHMTVEQNLSYGLKVKKYTAEQKQELLQMLERTTATLGLTELLHRFPSELSGGQQQRVALGRAIVLKPNLLLMDEPLSSLDTKLRMKVREELKDIQKRLGITTIYVTHDQEEALSLSDKIAVMENGNLVQYGTPEQVYFEPAGRFVADFTGRSNFLGEDEKLLVRPEWFSLEKDEGSEVSYKGTIVAKEFLGSVTRYIVKVEGEKNLITVDQNTVSSVSLNTGDKASLKIIRSWKI